MKIFPGMVENGKVSMRQIGGVAFVRFVNPMFRVRDRIEG
jgi:hypothetical protein